MAQFCAWYRAISPACLDTERSQDDDVVHIIVAPDSRTPNDPASLPFRLKVGEGRMVQRRGSPSPLRWTPNDNFSEVMMFKVNEIFPRFPFVVVPFIILSLRRFPTWQTFSLTVTMRHQRKQFDWWTMLKMKRESKK